MRKSGEERWVIIAAGIIDYAGKPATLGTLIDITDLKKLGGAAPLRAKNGGHRQVVGGRCP